MIQIERLYFSYSGAPPYVLDDLGLSIPDGEYVSVLGDNGSGKSTLIRLVLGLLRPSGGAISCTARRIGYVPQRQDVSNAQFPITVYEMLNCYRRLLKLREKNEVTKCLRRVQMEDSRHALVGTLSGGQMQKVLIARALMGSPDLLVLDEPSTGVDVSSQKEIYGLLKNLNRQSGITVLSVEHNLEAAVSNSTLIYHLSSGHGHLCSPEQYTLEFLGKNEGENGRA